jgi:short-subunit dehydrogenase
VRPFAADLAAVGAAESLATTVEQTLGPLDILVNNAGVEVASSFTRYSPEELDRILVLDLLVPLPLIHRLLPGMLARKAGHVVNICSLASKGPLPYGVPYAAAKWGLAGATQSLRAEYAGTDVGFSAVIPGFVTKAGIFARHEAQGVVAPALFGTTTPEKVGLAVVSAIRRDAPEILVTPRPIRPFLALAALAPRMAQRLTTWAGVPAVARRVAHLNGRIQDQPLSDDPATGAAPIHRRNQ